MSDDDQLFDIVVPEPLVAGEIVIAQTYVGDREAIFLAYVHEDGYPMVKVDLDGATELLNVARVRRASATI